MSLGRKYWDSFIKMMGFCALAFVIISLVFPQIVQVKYLHLMLAVAIPIHLFSYFTFELRLFSRHLWVRRFITIGFSMLTMGVVNLVFYEFRPSREFLIAFGILLALYIPLMALIYYVSDKIEKRNLELINQRLADENEK
ncbi:MAG: hypothetical protein IJW70_01150 [Clostridia bacterium]|nr:hypothetical protein [Clostridia bacterium]